VVSCSKCGGDYPKYSRRKKGRLKRYVASFCVLCHREDQRIRDARIYEWKLEYNRQWRRDNRVKVNKYNRKYWKREKESMNMWIFNMEVQYGRSISNSRFV
jgi:hypothetical protein